MRNTICIVGQIISILVVLAGVALAALAHLGAIGSNNFVIGIILLLAAFLVFCIFSALRKKTYEPQTEEEMELSIEDEDFFYKPGTFLLFGAIGGLVSGIKYSAYLKRYKKIKELYNNREYEKVLDETKKYYPYDDIPPSLKKLVESVKSFKDNEVVNDASAALAEEDKAN